MADAVAAKGVEAIGPPFEARGPLRVILMPLCLMLSAVKLMFLMLRRRPPIVHFFLPAPYVIGGPLSLLAGIPLRIMSRRSQNHYQARHAISRRLEQWLHGRMTALLGNSQRIVDELVGEEGADPARVGLIYNGIDVANFADRGDRADVRRSLGVAENSYVAITVANLIPYKGHAELIGALARVKDRLPDSWVLLCAGRDDGCQANLEEAARRVGLSDRIRFLGSRSDVPRLLAAADLGILASHEEGFSNAVLEGMAAGLPMVVTDVGGNKEAVIDGVHGRVVPPHDEVALGEAIAEIAGDASRARRMGLAGAEWARERFSIDTCVVAYEKFYEGLLGPSSSR